jgi:hypothetical protein
VIRVALLPSAAVVSAKTTSIVHTNAREAGLEVAEELVELLGRPPHLVIAFASAEMDPVEALAGLRAGLPDARIVGCSSYAEINSHEVLSGSLTAMGLCFNTIQFRTFAHTTGADPFEAGVSFAREVASFEPNLLILFPDGLAYNSTRLLLGIQSVLGQRFPIVGGIAADDAKFERTYQFHDDRCLTGAVVGVALKGPVEVVTAARCGWRPVGATRTATKVVDGNVLLELDGQPALGLYRQFLGERWAEMPSVGVEFPVGIVGGELGSQRMDGDGEILLLRAIKAIDEERQAIVFGGDLPEGARVRMSRANKDDVIAGANKAGDEVAARMPEPSFALVFDCMARKIALRERYKEEDQHTFAQLGPDVPKIGFHTFGELSPVSGVTMHHDETFTIALIRATESGT